MPYSYRAPKTTQERRQSQDEDVEKYIRPARNFRNLPNTYDDIAVGRGSKDSANRHFKRWLRNQVGKDWGQVFSDALKKFGEDARVWAKWNIEDEFTLFNEVPYSIRNTWKREPRPLYSTQQCPVYFIHPETKVLSLAPERPYVKKVKPITRLTTDDPMHDYRKISGIWYECWLVERLVSTWWYRNPKNQYSKKEIVVEKKRQLNKKELRKLGVAND